MPLRKASTVWAAIEQKRTASGMGQIEWRQSYEGVSAAFEYLGIKLMTSKREFDNLPIPMKDRGTHTGKDYGSRKVIVKRGFVDSVPTSIHSLLAGHNSLLTSEERQEIHNKIAEQHSSRTGKGLLTTNCGETSAIDDLDLLIESANILDRQHILEFRAADIAYKLKICVNNAWIGEQVKTAVASVNNECQFNHSGSRLNVKQMLEILNAGMVLTCIGLTQSRAVDVVWILHGPSAIDLLTRFDLSQRFSPILHLKIRLAAANQFTQAISDKQFRFDVGKSKKECARLLKRKIEIIKTGEKQSLQFWNEDKSQIPGKDHWTEQRSFNLTRSACAKMGVLAQRLHEDAYTLVDFRVSRARVQDKVRKRVYGNRHPGSHPYNPDEFDVLQVTCLEDGTAFVFPSRLVKDDKIESFFSDDQLMKCTVSTRNIWKTENAEYMHDLSTEEGAKSYVAACEAAAQIPPLTDRDFYQNMLNANQHLFCSKKELKKRKAEAQASDIEGESESDSDGK